MAGETYILDVLIQLGIFPEHVGFELGQAGVIFVRVDREYLAAGDRCRCTGSHIVPYWPPNRTPQVGDKFVICQT